MASERARLGDCHGHVFVAREQSAGRGQYGRTWLSDAGQSLLGSVVVTPPAELMTPAILTAWAAVALGDAIYQFTARQARIKWPNDLLLNGRKVCGILTELVGRNVIVGFGVNINQTQSDFDQHNLTEATSLRLQTDTPLDVEQVLSCVLTCLNQEWLRLRSPERVAVEADWKWRIGVLGRVVALELYDGHTVMGRVKDMSFDGVELETGDRGRQFIRPETIRHIRAK